VETVARYGSSPSAGIRSSVLSHVASPRDTGRWVVYVHYTYYIISRMDSFNRVVLFTAATVTSTPSSRKQEWVEPKLFVATPCRLARHLRRRNRKRTSRTGPSVERNKSICRRVTCSRSDSWRAARVATIWWNTTVRVYTTDVQRRRSGAAHKSSDLKGPWCSLFGVPRLYSDRL